MIRKVISGGQTGVDIAGLRAAAACRIPTGGCMPHGFLTEDGPKPQWAKRFKLEEHASPKYPPRTRQNVEMSDMTLIIADKMDRGSAYTRDLCFWAHKHVFHVNPETDFTKTSLNEVKNWVLNRPHKIVNIAGNRESRSPGICLSSTMFLIDLFEVINEP